MLWLIAFIGINQWTDPGIYQTVNVDSYSKFTPPQRGKLFLFIFSKKIKLTDDSQETLSLMFIQFVFSLKDNKSILEYHLQHICLATLSAVYARIKSG